MEGLAAAATSSESIDLTAPSAAGTYYYGACVEAVAGESDATNNCSPSVQVSVTEVRAETHPDLAVGSPSVSDSSPTSGATFSLSAAVRNDGDGAAAATTLHYYRSTDATITTADTSVGTDAVGGLAAAATSSESIDLTAPSAAGTYYYGACVEAVAGESDATNNCSPSVQVSVTEVRAETHPDLAVGSPSVSDSSPTSGATFSLSAAVRNDGDGAAAATTLHYYRSTDATITTADTSVGTDAVGGLAAAATSSESIDLTAPSAAGTYYYGACVEAVAGESDATNNCSTSVQVTVSETATGPDLDPYAIVVATNPGGTRPGGNVGPSVGVRNDGDESSAATTVRFYQSTDATITTADTEVGTNALAGCCKTPRNGIDRLIPSYYDAPHTEGSPIMRGHDEQTTHMFSYLTPEQRVPADHPLRAVRALTDEALQTMSRRFASLYATTGRPSIPPEQWLRALLLQVLYTVRSERLLMEALNDNLLFRWFVGLHMDDPVWHPTTLTKNRDRLLSGDVAAAFFDAVQAHARAAGLLSDEHFTVDGTQLEAWASLRSFRCVDAAESDPPEDPGNPTVNFHGERRRNDTHQSTTDPEAMLHRKGKGREPLRGPGADSPGHPGTLRGHRRRRGPRAAAASRPRVELFGRRFPTGGRVLRHRKLSELRAGARRQRCR